MRTDLAARNRQNAKRSTGPKTAEGKQRSSQNAFRHGLYSKQILLPHEDPEEFERLQDGLLEEHQPSTLTERLLVEEMAQNYWRIQRYRQLQDAGFEPGNLEAWIDGGLFNVLQRALSSAERAFHRALIALTKLKEQDEPASISEAQIQTMQQNRAREQAVRPDETISKSGFVPENHGSTPPANPQTPSQSHGTPPAPSYLPKAAPPPAH